MLLGVVALTALMAEVVAEPLLRSGVAQFTRNTSADWDDYLVSHRVLHRLAQIPAALVVYYGLGIVPGLPAALVTIGRNVAMAYSVSMAAPAATRAKPGADA